MMMIWSKSIVVWVGTYLVSIHASNPPRYVICIGELNIYFNLNGEAINPPPPRYEFWLT